MPCIFCGNENANVDPPPFKMFLAQICSHTVAGLLDVRMNISVLGFDDLFHEVPRRPIYPQLDKSEPSIDIIEDKETLKIIAHFPGLKKEDVSFEIKNGAIELEIKKNEYIKRTSIPCDIKPNKVSVDSTTYNNSVLEIIFKKFWVSQVVPRHYVTLGGYRLVSYS